MNDNCILTIPPEGRASKDPATTQPFFESAFSTRPGGPQRLLQPGAWIGAALILFLALAPQLQAGVVYNAGSGSPLNVNAGADFDLPITVSSTLTGSVTYWENSGFHLTWDPSVLTLQATAVDTTGSPLPITYAGNFFSPSSGQLNFTWNYSGTAYQVNDGSALFTIHFTAVGSSGSSTAISFSTLATIGLQDSSGNNFSSTIPTGNDATVNVVPEPIHYALGLFGALFVGSAALRRLRPRFLLSRRA